VPPCRAPTARTLWAVRFELRAKPLHALQVSTGKTRTLLGGGGEEGLCSLAACALLDRVQLADTPSDFTLALSVWEVGANNVLDLLREDPNAPARGSGADGVGRGFVSLRVRAPGEVSDVLDAARARSTNWAREAGLDGEWTALPNRAHTFVRIMLHDARRRRVRFPLRGIHNVRLLRILAAS
jgi:hypothetical protein